MGDFFLLLCEKMDFHCVIENLVVNPSLNLYQEMNRGLHNIPRVPISTCLHFNTMLHLQR